MRAFIRFAALAICIGSLGSAARADLVSQWAFDGDLLDSGPGANNGTYVGTGGPVFVEGRDGGGAISFNGTNEYVSIAQTTLLPAHVQPAFTVTFWVKGPPATSTVRDRRMFSEAYQGTTANNAPLFNLGTSNDGTTSPGSLDVYIRNDANTATVSHRKSARTILDDTWHHIAYVDDNGKVTVYIDGLVDSTDFSYTRTALTTTTTTFGAILRGTTASPSAGAFFQGAIDDARYYNHALTVEELKAVTTSEACPAEGDTTCTMTVSGPPAGQAGIYTISAAATDSSGDTTFYYFFRVRDGSGKVIREQGPGTLATLTVGFGPGTWTVLANVDDDPLCGDELPEATRTQVIEVNPAPELVAHWPLDGGFADATGNGNDGTFVGGDPVFTQGYDGTAVGALQLDGVDDYVDILPYRNLPIYTSPAFTIALWAKGLPQADKRLYSEGSSTSNTPLLNLGTQNTGALGKADIFIRNDNNVTPVNHRYSDRIALDGDWHHIAMVDDGGEVTLYIDGVRDAGSFEYVRGQLTSNRVSLGAILRAAPGNFFLGVIDEVRVYNYALTGAEVYDLVPEMPGCGPVGDTHLISVDIAKPEGGGPGVHTITAAAVDDSGDPILYTYIVEDPATGKILQQVGPTADLDSVDINLQMGTYRITVSVDDFIRCKDVAPDASQSVDLTVAAEADLLVAHWALNGDLVDSVTGNAGTFYGGEVPTFGEGFDLNPAGAIVLDGVEDFFRAGANPKLPLTRRDDFSISMWVTGPPSSPDVAALRDLRIFSESSARNTNFLYTLGTDNAAGSSLLSFFYRDDGGATVLDHARSVKPVFDGKWHHVAWIDRNGAVTLYIDGQLDGASISYIRSAAHAPDLTTIGGILRPTRTPPESHWFNGSIDEVNLFNYGISEGQVFELYRAGCPAEGDTHCTSLNMIEIPDEAVAGTWTFRAIATDDTGDAIIYTFKAMAETGPGEFVIGPQAADTAEFDLTPKRWVISVEVDDDPICDDRAEDYSKMFIIDVSACPAAGDTHCTGLEVAGPADGGPGTWTATAGAIDDYGHAIIYTFKAENGVDPATVIGPQAEASASFDLTAGTWTISVEVDDDPACPDAAADATLSKTVTVVQPGVGPFIRGDANDDAKVDISDAVYIFGWLFVGGEEPHCVASANVNGEEKVSISSGIYLLGSLFLGGPQPLPPYPGCGTSTLGFDKALGCASFNNCPK